MNKYIAVKQPKSAIANKQPLKSGFKSKSFEEIKKGEGGRKE